MEQNSVSKSHKIVISNRNKMELTGVTDVISFDTKEVILETTMGMLTFKGEDLKVNRLNIEKGELDIEGTVSGMTYSDISSYGKKKESLVKRMFK